MIRRRKIESLRARQAKPMGSQGIVLLGGLLLSACTMVGPDFKRPEAPWLDAWSGGSLESLGSVQRGKQRGQIEEWWRNFNDPVLVRLIAEALRLNPNVRTAGVRILEARAQLRIAGSTLYPQVQQVTGDILYVGEEVSGGPDTSFMAYNAGVGIGWELDFWGKFRRTIESADAGYYASIAQYDDVQILLTAQVSTLYSSIRTLEERLQIAHENAALQKRSLEITERLFRSGNESELDLQQAKSLYLSTLATIPQLEGSLRQTQNALSVLLARPPGPLPEMTAGKDGIPTAELDIIIDMPANLLRRRPDVRAAEMQLAAQSALIGVSEAELYPHISLLGSLGLSATSLAGPTTAMTWGIGPSFVWNVFSYGRLTSEVLVQDARFQQSFEQYKDVVLRAAREVDDAAVGFAKSRVQMPLLTDSVQAARRSFDIATIQYKDGLVDFQRVLDSQRTLFSQQERLVNNLGSVTQNLIALYKAMGGGWQQGRRRPLLDDATRESMGERSDWKTMLREPLPAPGAEP